MHDGMTTPDDASLTCVSCGQEIASDLKPSWTYGTIDLGDNTVTIDEDDARPHHARCIPSMVPTSPTCATCGEPFGDYGRWCFRGEGGGVETTHHLACVTLVPGAVTTDAKI